MLFEGALLTDLIKGYADIFYLSEQVLSAGFGQLRPYFYLRDMVKRMQLMHGLIEVISNTESCLES